MITAEFNIKLENPKQAYEALKPDLENTDRFKVKVLPKKGELYIQIEAKDLTAARAAINSYLRLINTVKEIEEVE